MNQVLFAKEKPIALPYSGSGPALRVNLLVSHRRNFAGLSWYDPSYRPSIHYIRVTSDQLLAGVMVERIFGSIAGIEVGAVFNNRAAKNTGTSGQSRSGKFIVKTNKVAILKRIAKNLAYFHPEHRSHFMCPICLVVIPLHESHNISEAHITPKFSGGSLKTFLCKKCNSKFGANQDKWLGEYLRLKKSGKSIFNITKQTGRFSNKDIPVSGQFRESETGGIEFFIWGNKTSPQSLEQLDKVSKNESLSVSAVLPLLQNTRQVEVGLLTAAYLMWFKEIGYSWVFQSHLDEIREQILNPTDMIINQIAVGDLGKLPAKRPWIGIVEIGDTALAAAGIVNHVVFLPTFSTPDIGETLSSLRGKTFDTNHQKLRYCDGHKYGLPFGILYKEQGIVASNRFSGATFQYGILRYDGTSEKPTILHPISEDDYERLADNPEAKHITISPKVD